MQNDQELLSMIKEAYPQAPRKEFIDATEMKLRQKAKGMKKKSQIKKLTAVSSGLILFALTFSWLFFFSGNEVLTNVASNLGAEALSATGSDKEPIVYIYQTHTIESYVDELNPDDVSKVFSDTKNVTLVGKELSKELEKLDISTLHDETNFIQMTEDRNLPFKDAYKVSREVLQQALDDHKSIKMMLDIHRDSFKRAESTINIDGVDYAKIGLAVSKTTKNYEENKDFALEIHEKLEQKYPGLSRGVFEQGVQPKNTYNQDLHDNSVLLNIGGVENTFEEAYRSTDALAEVIKEIIEENY